MQVDYVNNTIRKPKGEQTPAAVIPFQTLLEYLIYFRAAVDTETATHAMAAWAAAGYPEQQVIDVLKAVIVTFGGGHRIWGKFGLSYEKSPSHINALLSKAHRRQTDTASELLALINPIKGLGSQSYSTKVLRFINPNLYVVLDSVLRAEMGMDESDYDIFVNHCRRIAKTLGVTPADVEGALYAYVQMANPEQRSHDWRYLRNKKSES